MPDSRSPKLAFWLALMKRVGFCETLYERASTRLHMPSFAVVPDLILPHAFQPFDHDGARQFWTRCGMAVWHCLVELLPPASSLRIGFF